MDRQSQERSTEESSSRRESLMTTSSVTSERRTSYQSVRPAASGPEEPSNVTSTATMNVGSKSFLQDRTPVRGMQDIIGRMRAGDVGESF